MKSSTTQFVLFSWVGLFLLLVGCNRTGTVEDAANIPRLGDPAPNFSLQTVREGETIHLAELAGQTVLLSFLNTQTEVSATPEPSRNQIVFLRSMMDQYAGKGTAVFIIDATQLATGQQPTQDELINFTYNWNLDTIPVLSGSDDNSVAAQYGVTQLPTTVLIDGDGIIRQRWEGFASASQLAFALQEEVGLPTYSEADASIATKQCVDETAVQAKFAGLPLARSLSREIWLVDGGQAWPQGEEWAVQWLILTTQPIADLQIQIHAQHKTNPEASYSLAGELTPIPENEAAGLLVDPTQLVGQVYSVITPIQLTRPGCYQLEVSINDQSDNIIYTGQGSIPTE